MPDIDKVEPTLYQPLDPYHWHFDNLPIQSILERENLINAAVDINSQTLRDAAGTQGTVANRLDQSIAPDGSIEVAAVDEAMHNIAAHADGTISLTTDEIDGIADDLGYIVSNPVPYVRMLDAERDKLALVSDQATALKLQVEGASTTTTFDDETVILTASPTVTWQATAPNRVEAHLAFPAEAAHAHIYGATPVPTNLGSPDYTHYKTTSTSTVFVEDSLRVYVNGVRVNADAAVYVPGPSGPNGTWHLTTFAPSHSAGTFYFSRALDPDDVIVIDFDISYA